MIYEWCVPFIDGINRPLITITLPLLCDINHSPSRLSLKPFMKIESINLFSHTSFPLTAPPDSQWTSRTERIFSSLDCKISFSRSVAQY
jgi:hypothetical protein